MKTKHKISFFTKFCSFQNEIRKSLITDIFAGKFRSMVHSSGNQKSVVHEPFFTLSLDIKVRHH
jgi:hypothetical protein